MKFPQQKYGSIAAYLDSYAGQLTNALASIDRARLADAEAMLSEGLQRDSHIYACGNGGSASIANHLVCDHVKGIQTDTDLRPRVHSLSSNIELITAIGNDIDFDDIFIYQIAGYGRAGDVFITISASGDSENIVRALQWAKSNGLKSIALTGFSGGRSAKLADVNLHVSAENYGVVEDAHQSLMHILAQYIRQSRMSGELVAKRKF